MIANYRNQSPVQKSNLLHLGFYSLLMGMGERLNLAKFSAPKFSSRRLTSAAVILGIVFGSSVVITPVAQAASAPKVTSISPAVGTISGGTLVTITGTGLGPLTSVTVGGVPFTSVVLVSATSITAVTPVGTVGAKSVVVTNTDTKFNAANTAFTYQATVTFNANAGAGTMSAQATNVATNLTTNTFTRTGFTFAGWNTVAGGGGTAYANSASYPFTADVTLFARWSVVAVAITLVRAALPPTFGARTPTFGTPTPTATGFTVTIANFNGAWSYAGSASNGGTVSITGSRVKVTGIAAGTSSTASITATRPGFASGARSVTAVAITLVRAAP